MKKQEFPYKYKDIVSFPDTETETVDVGIGYVPVAQQVINTIVEVVKRGRGLALRMLYKSDYSEVFHIRGLNSKGRKNYISLKKYLDHFSTYKDLELIGNKETWEQEDY